MADDVDWDRLLELAPPHPETAGWVTLQEASDAAGVSISALRSWYRSGRIRSRLEPGRHGDRRLVPLDEVLDEALRSPRLQRQLARSRTLADEVAELRDRVERLEGLVARLLPD